MILGQSAATAACLAMDHKVSVQGLDVKKLQERLVADKQILDRTGIRVRGAIDIRKLEGIVVDDDDAKRTGFESTSASIAGFVGSGYRHDGGVNKGRQTAIYTPSLPAAGMYEVRLYYTEASNRARKVPVTILHSGGSTMDVIIDQTKKPNGGYMVLGKFKFDQGSTGNVTISNQDTVGHVVIDAVQFVPAK